MAIRIFAIPIIAWVLNSYAALDSGIVLVSPKGGSTYHIGDTMLIKAAFDTVTIKAMGGTEFAAEISFDNGKTFHPLASINYAFGGTLSVLPWTTSVLDTFFQQDTADNMYNVGLFFVIPESLVTVDGDTVSCVSEKVRIIIFGPPLRSPFIDPIVISKATHTGRMMAARPLPNRHIFGTGFDLLGRPVDPGFFHLAAMARIRQENGISHSNAVLLQRRIELP
jgi:hypothetical protein